MWTRQRLENNRPCSIVLDKSNRACIGRLDNQALVASCLVLHHALLDAIGVAIADRPHGRLGQPVKVGNECRFRCRSTQTVGARSFASSSSYARLSSPDQSRTGKVASGSARDQSERSRASSSPLCLLNIKPGASPRAFLCQAILLPSPRFS